MRVLPRAVEVAELSMQLVASLGPATYWAFLVDVDDGPSTLAQLNEEVHGLDKTVKIALYGGKAEGIVPWIAKKEAVVLLVDATGFGTEEWTDLDLRRSSLAHEGPVVFIMGHDGFSDLMRVAPNLASWLGGNVLTKDDGKQAIEEARTRRLAALQLTLNMSDDAVLRAAEAGTLPRDPEYAEWLTLLGRGDLL